VELRSASPRFLSARVFCPGADDVPDVVALQEASVTRAGRVVVDRVTFSLQPGITGFVGRNGAGKSSTLQLLAGMLRPSGGRVVRHVPASRTAFLPELLPLTHDLTVREQLRFAAELQDVARAQTASRIDALIGTLSLIDVENRLVGALSKGTQQRVALAQAMLCEPLLLLLDEPTSGLDPAECRSLAAELRRRADDGACVFFSSHVFSEVQALADRVLLIDAGRIVYDGAPTSAPSMGRA
jgi:ABC-2 type transport system ATP-binding protein